MWHPTFTQVNKGSTFALRRSTPDLYFGGQRSSTPTIPRLRRPSLDRKRSRPIEGNLMLASPRYVRRREITPGELLKLGDGAERNSIVLSALTHPPEVRASSCRFAQGSGWRVEG